MIIGAGAIGIEFAYIFNAFGAKVTVVEMLPNILPAEDAEVSQALEKSFAKQGIQLLTNHKTTKTEANDAIGENEGFVKVVVGEPYGEILGARIIGSDATELIAELGPSLQS